MCTCLGGKSQRPIVTIIVGIIIIIIQNSINMNKYLVVVVVLVAMTSYSMSSSSSSSSLSSSILLLLSQLVPLQWESGSTGYLGDMFNIAYRGIDFVIRIKQLLLSQLVPLQACRDTCRANYQKAPATIHILLMTTNDHKMLRALPVTDRRSKKEGA